MLSLYPLAKGYTTLYKLVDDFLKVFLTFSNSLAVEPTFPDSWSSRGSTGKS